MTTGVPSRRRFNGFRIELAARPPPPAPDGTQPLAGNSQEEFDGLGCRAEAAMLKVLDDRQRHPPRPDPPPGRWPERAFLAPVGQGASPPRSGAGQGDPGPRRAEGRKRISRQPRQPPSRVPSVTGPITPERARALLRIGVLSGLQSGKTARSGAAVGVRPRCAPCKGVGLQWCTPTRQLGRFSR